MPRMQPPVSEVSVPFWDATKDEKYLLQWCKDCEKPIHYPREVCPTCLGTNLEWREAAGTGTVYAVSVQHRGTLSRDPYPVALVELTEGPRVMTNIVGCEPYDVTVDMKVQVTWEPLSDGRKLPLFEPAS